MSDQPRLGTRAVWAGEEEYLLQGATQVPVVHSVSFGYHDLDEWLQVATGQKAGFIYSRNTNPTVQAFEEKVRSLEDAEAATSAATGMGVIHSTLFTLLSPGERVISVKDTYGGTNVIFSEFLPRFQIGVTLCDTSDNAQIEAEIAKGCQVLYLESPTNPTTKVVDIACLTHAARAVGAVVVVDNTFATPINQNPLQLGADLVIHSATKYLGGHSDVVAGLVAGSKEHVSRLWRNHVMFGPVLHPFEAWLLERGLKTFAMRMARHNENGLAVARYLSEHPAVARVHYPGLEEHPQYELAKKQMPGGFGGMVCFELSGGREAGYELLKRVQLITLAVSLGGTHSLITHPASTISIVQTEEEVAASGVRPGAGTIVCRR